MATENRILTHSFVASGSGLSAAAAQFSFVAITTNKKIIPATAGVRTLGILQDNPRANKAGAVCFEGSISKLRLGATVKANIFVRPDANGYGQPARGGVPVGGMALEDGVSGEVISVLVLNGSL